jgi:hypothetical protein
MSAEKFKESIRRCRQSSSYFPTPFDVISKYRVIKNEDAVHAAAALPMPDEIPEAQAEINRTGIEGIRKRLAKRFDIKNAK